MKNKIVSLFDTLKCHRLMFVNILQCLHLLPFQEFWEGSVGVNQRAMAVMSVI